RRDRATAARVPPAHPRATAGAQRRRGAGARGAPPGRRPRRRAHPPHRAGARYGPRDPPGARASRGGGAAAGHALPGAGGLTMSKHLVVVESPAKAKTLSKYLGRDYQVKASVGHVVDLPKSKLGVDIERDFKAEYTVIHGKTAVLNEIKQAAKDKETVYLAPD